MIVFLGSFVWGGFDAHGGCFHIRKLFHCQNALSNASPVMKKEKKKKPGEGLELKVVEGRVM